MPIYRYKCIKCSHEFELVRSMSRRNSWPVCEIPECGFPSKIVPSLPSLQTNPGTKLRAKLDKKKPPKEYR